MGRRKVELVSLEPCYRLYSDLYSLGAEVKHGVNRHVAAVKSVLLDVTIASTRSGRERVKTRQDAPTYSGLDEDPAGGGTWSDMCTLCTD